VESHTETNTLHTACCAAADAVAEVFDGASSEDVVSALQGRKLLGAHRKGKQMWLTFQGDKPNLLMHFGKLMWKRQRQSMLLLLSVTPTLLVGAPPCVAGMTGYIAVKDSEDAMHVLAYEK
jgi:hypothetical protein